MEPAGKPDMRVDATLLAAEAMQTAGAGGQMLVRVLTMRVQPGKLDDWKRYTREIGFPGMLAQPGCTKVWRMRRHGAEEGEYQVITLWDSLQSLERFKASQAMRDLSASAAALTIPPYAEVLYSAVPD